MKQLAGCIASLILAVSAVAAEPAATPQPIADGPFKGTVDSLRQYQYPDWFRDAKFGIWAHWGPQSVPMEGDWYAKHMYEQGSAQYQYHVAHYGHPSQFGYKDLIPLWKAEKWDPDRLMQLYKRAGARYFVSMGTHHDNFFLWSSKLHRWNSVNMGPKRDVVGEWQKAATKYGLRFGVSEHLGASFTWLQTSHGSDKTGPQADVPYDGADPAYQDLYHFPAEPGDTGWLSNNPRWHQQWCQEITELVDNYHPDLLYSDSALPFGDVGATLVAHFYNTKTDSNGQTMAVYNCKQDSEGRWVQDVERGILPRIEPYPWQTDTSIGDWFYNRNWKYRPVSWVIYMLVDNVSKNGNLLLNVVQRPDGTLDPEVEAMLEQLADWTATNGQAIYGTRPWLVYGESAIKVKGGAFKEDFAYNAREIRFTTKDGALYAFTLGWPADRQVLIRSLARPDGRDVNHITSVSLLGYEGQIQWKQSNEGLLVTLPEMKSPQITAALKIIGSELTNVPYDSSIRPDAQGRLKLSADAADADHGIEPETIDGQVSLGRWDNPQGSVTWDANFTRPGKFQVSATVAARWPSEFTLQIGDAQLPGHTPATGQWNSFQSIDLGTVEITVAGKKQVKMQARDATTWKPINLRAVTFSPVGTR